MYQYKCTVSDFADENAYIGVIEKIRDFYPHHEYAEEFNECSRTKTIIVPDKKGDPAAVRVEVNFKKSKTFVKSETYLDYIFLGQKVRPNITLKGTLIRLVISAAFLIVNYLVMAPDYFMLAFIFTLLSPPMFLMFAAPIAIIHFIAALVMRETMVISPGEIFFIELGGLPLVLTVAVNFFLSHNIYHALSVIHYIVYIMPFAALGALIASAVTRKK